MKRENHPNYYERLLAKGAKVAVPLKLTPGGVKQQGRMWNVSAVLQLGPFTIHLRGLFHGKRDSETEENGAANLMIEHVRMSVEGGAGKDYVDFHRKSFKLIMLSDGVYGCSDHNEEIGVAVRNVCGYNTALYSGIPTAEDLKWLSDKGYKRLIEW